MKKLIITFIILDILVAICFFVVYSPVFENLQNTIISTATVTKTHGYIAHIFYSDQRIKKVTALNSVPKIDEEIDLNRVVIDTKPRTSYDNPYDEAILTRDKGNEDYKYISVKVGKYDGHLVAIYDPSKVHIITGKKFNTSNKSGKETVLQMTKRLNAVVGINGGGFVDYGYGSDIPIGYVIKDGKVIWSPTDKKTDLIGFTKDNKLLLVHATGEEAVEMGMRDALQFGPFLMINGEKPKFSNSAGGFSRAARVAIAQRKDGIVLFLVTEGTHAAGPTMKEVIDTLEKYGAYNAANLDGGTSTQLVIKDKLINHPINITGQAVNGGRGIVTGWGLILDDNKS
jgi:exopolysaccharide biosynthesis protein